MFYASGFNQYFQAYTSKRQYKNEILHDSNMIQQCPKLEIGTVDVEMLEEPHTDEDAPTDSLLRRSSQKAAHDMTQSVKLQAKEGPCRKSNRLDGPTRGRPFVPPR